MKPKHLLINCVFISIIACNQNKTGKVLHQHTEDSTVQSSTKENKEALVLNDGKKWKLDESTRKNIGPIKEYIQSAEKESKTDYKKLANGLEAGANNLIQECRMSGKDHEMLHFWLEKFLSTLKQLKNSQPGQEEAFFNELKHHVNNFDDYFE